MLATLKRSRNMASGGSTRETNRHFDRLVYLAGWPASVRAISDAADAIEFLERGARKEPRLRWTGFRARFASWQLRLASRACGRRDGDHAACGSIMAIQAIRAWVARDPAAQSGLAMRFGTSRIGRAITLIHRNPATDWTLVSGWPRRCGHVAVGVRRTVYSKARRRVSPCSTW